MGFVLSFKILSNLFLIAEEGILSDKSVVYFIHEVCKTIPKIMKRFFSN